MRIYHPVEYEDQIVENCLPGWHKILDARTNASAFDSGMHYEHAGPSSSTQDDGSFTRENFIRRLNYWIVEDEEVLRSAQCLVSSVH